MHNDTHVCLGSDTYTYTQKFKLLIKTPYSTRITFVYDLIYTHIHTHTFGKYIKLAFCSHKSASAY